MKSLKKILICCLAVSFFTSCSKGDDHNDACHECHLAFPDGNGGEIIWEITNAAGGEDFCGDELTEVEAPNYDYSDSEILISMSGNDTLQPGDYGASNGYEIHCGDHSDH